MNLKTIKAEVQDIVSDPRFDGKLVEFINAAYTNGVSIAKLPEYKKFGTLKTVSGSNVAVVTDEVEDFAGEILHFFPVSGSVIAKYDSLEEMIREERIDALGVIDSKFTAMALEGTNLWYNPIPQTPQSIQFIYMAKPEALESDSDEITIFPELIQRLICVHGACVQCFEVIEDALEQPDKMNTNYHKKKYEEGIIKLQEWNGRRRVHKASSSWRQ